MASTRIIPVVLAPNTGVGFPDAVAIDAADGGLIDFTLPDHKTLVVLEAASAVTATIKAGNGVQGVLDLAVSIPANGRVCLRLESMKYAMASGVNMGKVKITGSGVKVACVVLP